MRKPASRRAPIDFHKLKENAQTFISVTFRGQSHEFNLLFAITLTLLVIGLVMVLDASYVTDVAIGKGPFATFLKQLAIGAVGLFALALSSHATPNIISKATPKFYFAAIVLQIFTANFGVSIGGNRNWISLGALGNFQPSEVLKVAMILQVASLLQQRSQGFFTFGQRFGPALFAGAVAMAVVGLGKDMGTVMVMAAIVLLQLFFAGIEKKHLYALLVAGGALALAFTRMSANRWARTVAWANPYGIDPGDVNWQSKHGIWALAAGGFSGVGFGKSTMKWSWIPEVDNDYIFAIIGEEFGFLGAAVIIILFVWLAVILIRIMNKTSDLHSKLIVGGVLGWLTFQALVNIAVVLSMLPVLGVPLPMISSGGSSLLANLGAIGIVLSIERQNSNRAVPVRRR